ncbi:MAG: tetratricopeptide repeat protein [Spirochaetaceae bacterium]
MAKSILRHLGLVTLLTLLLTGCVPVRGHLEVLRGNYYYSRGEYQESIVSYLTLLDEPESREYVSYNLGNVYQALGEGNAARRMWDQAEGSGDEDLLYRVSFNRGVFYYDRGEYQRAYDAFKEALRLNNGSVPAKINLELTLLQLSAEEQLTPQAGEQEAEGTGEIGSEALRVLEFVRREERQRWEANREPETSEYQRDW